MRSSPPATCEPLEGRQLLAADIVVSSLAGRFPADLVSGTRGCIPGLSVQLTNSGDQDVHENVVVRLLASADGAPDGADFILAEQTTRLRLNSGRQRRLPIRLREVPQIPQGAYRLIAQVDATDVVAEDNEGNNFVGSTGPINIGPAFVNLTAESLWVDAPLVPGRPNRIGLTVLNAGNVDARGRGAVSVVLAPVGQPTGETVTVDVKINVRSRKSGVLRGRFVVPPTLAAGQYTVRATIAQTLPFQDTVADDNSATETPVTVR